MERQRFGSEILCCERFTRTTRQLLHSSAGPVCSMNSRVNGQAPSIWPAYLLGSSSSRWEKASSLDKQIRAILAALNRSQSFNVGDLE